MEADSRRRLEELERKVDRILRAVEKSGANDPGKRKPTTGRDESSAPGSALPGSHQPAANRRVDVTIGSDDGLLPGPESSVYRARGPRSKSPRSATPDDPPDNPVADPRARDGAPE